jgi:hypothetical protein
MKALTFIVVLAILIVTSSQTVTCPAEDANKIIFDTEFSYTGYTKGNFEMIIVGPMLHIYIFTILF